jgi:hypothetical protein
MNAHFVGMVTVTDFDPVAMRSPVVVLQRLVLVTTG